MCVHTIILIKKNNKLNIIIKQLYCVRYKSHSEKSKSHSKRNSVWLELIILFTGTLGLAFNLTV